MTDSKKNIVLIGMPGSGKSTVGTILSRKLKYPFIDVDDIIQSEEGERLQKIIRTLGVEGFCRTEEKHLLGVSCEKHIIATGGSAVYSSSGMTHLRNIGIIVFLEIGLDALKKRLGDIDARGVARQPGETLDILYAKRRPLYLRYADHTVSTERHSAESAAERIIRLIFPSYSHTGQPR